MTAKQLFTKSSRKKRTLFLILLLSLIAVASCNNETSKEAIMVKEIDLSSFPATPPDKKINILFIHHSCGGQWLADAGTKDDCKDWICKTSKNGGGLRSLLEENNYVVHEASYGSIIGEKTDIPDWPPKFRDHMDRILRTKMQDELLPNDHKNQIIMFKSCFPNNNFTSEKVVQEAKDAYKKLPSIFKKYPDVLFVAVTAPPLVSPNNPKNILKRFLGRWVPDKESGKRARTFNNWLKDIEKGWLANYPLRNVVVFDYYDILTKHGKSNWSEYGSKGGTDSHPNSAGNRIATDEFIPFINKAVRYAGIIKDDAKD